MHKNMKMFRYHEVTREKLSKYPNNSLWVDIWHLAFPSPDGEFSINLKSSTTKFRCYYCQNVKKIGTLRCYGFKEMLQICEEMIESLGLKVDDFNFLGSTLGDTSFLRNKLNEVIKCR